jgi:hypothetical protein
LEVIVMDTELLGLHHSDSNDSVTKMYVLGVRPLSVKIYRC